jgi:hypothetical protein
MASTIYRITLREGTPRRILEKAVAEAIFAAECIHGTAKVRLAAGYYMAEDRPQCIFDVGTPVGEQVAQLFTGILSRRLGEGAFHVERAGGEMGRSVV